MKLDRSSLDRDCRRQVRRRAPRPDGEDPPVSISGHVTHQNGVRMSGVTMTLYNGDDETTRTVLTDEMGNYFFGNIPWGSYIELEPSRVDYEFFPPMIIWHGIVDDETINFIAKGPPPPPPPPPANQPTLAWSSYFDNTPHFADYNAAIGRDGAGNIYVGGTSYTEDDNSGDTDIVLSKTDINGNRVWARSFNGLGDYKDALRDMVVDAEGNIYIAGYSYMTNEDPALSSYDYVLLKYNTGGELLWTKYYGGNLGYDDFARSLKVDAAGNAYIAGYSWGVGTYANYATVKYDSSGNQVWAKRFSGGNGEILNEVEIDAVGNVYVTGYSNRTAGGGSEDIVTIKYDAAGNQVWLNRYNSASDESDEGYGLEITPQGDVMVLGETYDFSVSTTVVHKINGGTGETVWTRPVDIDATRGMYAEFIKLDPDANIVLTGMLFDDESYNVDSFVAKLDPEATILWSEFYDGPSDDDYDGDPKTTIDSDGNIYLVATSEGFANAEIQVVKYLSDGTLDWTYRYGNPFFYDDYVTEYSVDSGEQRSILLDPQGNVYVAGESYIPDQATNLVAFKLEPVAQTRAVPYDFDGDRKADVAIYRPETGVWWVLNSSDGTYSATNWGISSDAIVPADYDGDGRFDKAIYRDGIWYVLNSSSGGYTVGNFGLAADKPVPADFDNDGKADLGVFRGGTWHLLQSSDGAYKANQFGIDSDTPIPADYDSNRVSDVAVFRGGTWYVRYQDELPTASLQFGVETDKPVPADYDGDRKTDHAVFRNGVWYIWESRSGAPSVVQWGVEGDVPVPADYDGDRKSDLAVYRQGVWYIRRSSDGGATILQFGLATDIPVPAAFSK